MKNYLLHFCFLAFALLSLCGCDNLKYAELYEITDEFVEELHTDVESYGLLGGVDDTEYTDDGAFRVLPMGRLVNVKIEHDATDEEYAREVERLSTRYPLSREELERFLQKGGEATAVREDIAIEKASRLVTQLMLRHAPKD